MFGFKPYNYDQFRSAMLVKDFAKSKFGGAPKPGDKAPDFELRSIDGDKVRLSDFERRKNVVLTFGSATCPQTAASIHGINELYNEFSEQDVQFLFVYVREAHPGDELPAHRSMDQKVRAAELLRDEDGIEFPVLVDDTSGKVHKKYGSMPNPTFVIDRSGRVAFRSLGSRASKLGEAIEELLHIQEETGRDHAIVLEGEDLGVPPLSMFLHAHRALERGGDDAVNNFRREMGVPGRLGLVGGRMARPVVEHPMGAMTAVAATAGVIAAGLWVGSELRKRRFANTPYDVYRSHRTENERSADDYAVGI